MAISPGEAVLYGIAQAVAILLLLNILPDFLKASTLVLCIRGPIMGEALVGIIGERKELIVLAVVSLLALNLIINIAACVSRTDSGDAGTSNKQQPPSGKGP